MTKYKDKHCGVCGRLFTPTNPNQKYCIVCKDEGRKLTSRIRDREISRKKCGYIEHHRVCESCGKKFSTYYTKKRFCGSEVCEKERVRLKNKKMQLNRSARSERDRYKNYYNKNKEFCRLQKAVKYRESCSDVKLYVPRGFHKHTIDYVRDYVEQFGYKLLSDKYVNSKSKIELLCPEGHEWETTFHNFRDNGGNKGNRCLYCYLQNNYTSRPEQKLLDYFVENCPQVRLVHNDRKQIAPLELDLYFPDSKLGVEVCGLYWHSEISGEKSRKYHYDKMMKCFEKGIRLITVFEDEIRDKFDIVVSRVLQAIGLTPNRVYARKCEVREIDSKLANKFFESNHIQGRTQPTKSWGLFYDHKLVQACSIGRFIRKHTANELSIELRRFCSKKDTTIVGGFSKLFKRVIIYCTDNNYKSIASYCDMRYGNIFSPVYELANFELNRFTKYTPHYIKKGKRYRNFSLRKTEEERKTGKTEFELRREQGYDRIWDCGHRSYLYKIK